MKFRFTNSSAANALAPANSDWSNQQAVVDYQVGAWRLLSGSAHPFDEAAVRAMAIAAFERSPCLLTTFNHATLEGADGWEGRLGENPVRDARDPRD